MIDDKLGINCSPDDHEDRTLGFVDYQEKPREYVLNTCTTTIEVRRTEYRAMNAGIWAMSGRQPLAGLTPCSSTN